MSIYLLILIFVVITGMKAASAGEFCADYMSKEKTACVKGIFVILVLFRHASQYMNTGGIYDEPFLLLEAHTGQMIVAMFFFYSGYGMMEAVKKKGFSYVKSVLFRRLPDVWLRFCVAVFLFLLLDLCLGKLPDYDWQTILLSFTGWENIGNSNWYMFAVFILYILFFLSFLPLAGRKKRGLCFLGAILLTLFTVVFVYWQIRMGQPAYFYNTVILLPLGVWYSLLRPWIETCMMQSEIRYMAVCAVLVTAYALTHLNRGKYGIYGYTVWAVVFTLSIVCFTMKISINSTVLSWFGNHVFSVYMLQRLPMIFMSKWGFGYSHRYFFLAISIVVTILMAQIFDTVAEKIASRKKEIRSQGI